MPSTLVRVLILAAIVAVPRTGPAQTPVTRDDAIGSALAHGARFGVAVADTSAAYARLLTARAWQNPALSATYSRAVPTWHYLVEIPIDIPGRSARIGAARAGRAAAQFRFAFERAAAALDADTTYTRALAARSRAALSRRNAADFDSLRRMVITRRDAGDASDLDVELATVTAGQAANTAAADSLTYLATLLDLQVVMGVASDRVAVIPTDSLTPPPPVAGSDTALPALAPPLQVAAAAALLESARLAVRAERRSVFSVPGIVGGVETGDPDQTGLLPTFGLSLAVPLFNRNKGPIMQAEAEQARARAELTLAEAEGRAAVARGRRALAIAGATLERDRALVASADRVATLSLTAYREGASSLPVVLEAQRNARDVQAQYVDDLAAAWIAAAELRVLTQTAGSRP